MSTERHRRALLPFAVIRAWAPRPSLPASGLPLGVLRGPFLPAASDATRPAFRGREWGQSGCREQRSCPSTCRGPAPALTQQGRLQHAQAAAAHAGGLLRPPGRARDYQPCAFCSSSSCQSRAACLRDAGADTPHAEARKRHTRDGGRHTPTPVSRGYSRRQGVKPGKPSGQHRDVGRGQPQPPASAPSASSPNGLCWVADVCETPCWGRAGNAAKYDVGKRGPSHGLRSNSGVSTLTRGSYPGAWCAQWQNRGGNVQGEDGNERRSSRSIMGARRGGQGVQAGPYTSKSLQGTARGQRGTR